MNRGCVPSKALLAASGRVRDMKNDMHLKSLGIQVSETALYVSVLVRQSCMCVGEECFILLLSTDQINADSVLCMILFNCTQYAVFHAMKGQHAAEVSLD